MYSRSDRNPCLLGRHSAEQPPPGQSAVQGGLRYAEDPCCSCLVALRLRQHISHNSAENYLLEPPQIRTQLGA